MPKLVDHVGQLRREIADVRAAELEKLGRLPAAGTPNGAQHATPDVAPARELVTHDE